jgi:hypothetical protein
MRGTNPAFDDNDVYDLTPNEPAEPIPAEWRASAMAAYKLETAVRCPHCSEYIDTIRIVGLTRTQVSFTSIPPRKGRVAICPECDRMLPVELSGLV